jgi:hypothetical protein
VVCSTAAAAAAANSHTSPAAMRKHSIGSGLNCSLNQHTHTDDSELPQKNSILGMLAALTSGCLLQLVTCACISFALDRGGTMLCVLQWLQLDLLMRLMSLPYACAGACRSTGRAHTGWAPVLPCTLQQPCKRAVLESISVH